MSRLAQAEVEREARRVLRRLASPRAALLPRGGGYAVARAPSGAAASRVTLGADFVTAFLRAGWIAAAGPDRYVIAQAGLDLLARGGADGFAAQHRLLQDAVLEEGADRRSVKINSFESPLARLKARALVDGIQFAAGEKLRRDYTLGQLAPRMGVDWSAPVVSGGRGAGRESVSDIALAARQRFNRALAAVGPGLSDLLFDVCCALAALERAEDARGWSRRSGRVVLKIALDRLAAHYGFDVVREKGAIRSWSAEGAS